MRGRWLVLWLVLSGALVGCSLDRHGLAATSPVSTDAGGRPDAADARPGADASDARDATMDAGHDVGADVGLSDAALDSGSDLGPDAGATDADAALDTGPVEPVCPAGCECEQDCSLEACNCGGGCPCSLSCTVFCGGKCDGADTVCSLEANASANFSFGCDHGARCSFHVAATASATLDCRHASTCDAECVATASCQVRCREGSVCSLRCGIESGCWITECPPEELHDCGGGLQVCNQPCP